MIGMPRGTSDARAVHDGRDLRHTHARDDACGADGARADEQSPLPILRRVGVVTLLLDVLDRDQAAELKIGVELSTVSFWRRRCCRPTDALNY